MEDNERACIERGDDKEEGGEYIEADGGEGFMRSNDSTPRLGFGYLGSLRVVHPGWRTHEPRLPEKYLR
jgi:hypothetical protein